MCPKKKIVAIVEKIGEAQEDEDPRIDIKGDTDCISLMIHTGT